MMRSNLFVVLFSCVLLCACSGEEEASPTPTATPSVTAIDLRFEAPAAPDGGVQLVGPDLIIQPYEDKIMCLFLKPSSDDIAVNQILSYQAEYGHHAVLLATTLSEEDYPTNSVVDCTDPGTFPMEGLSSFLTPITDDPLPEGFASKIQGNVRFVFQSHYINTLSEPILVRDVINFGRVPIDSVTTWVNGWSTNFQGVDIPANTMDYSRTFTCTFTQDLTIMNLIGHMHEWGSHLTVVHNRLDGTQKELYDYDWKPEYRDNPPIKIYEGDMFQVKTGESITANCSWFNDTDHAIVFPHEMCAIAGNAYPLEFGWNCNVLE